MEVKIGNAIQKDVVVIGGGTAGVFSAIASADAGADTLLVEKNSVLGGTMTAGGVAMPGLFYAWGKRILGGHAWEIIREIMEEGQSEYPEIAYFRREHWLEQFRLNPYVAEYVLERNCKKYGVQVLLHTMLAGIEETEDGCELLLCGKEGLFSVSAKTVIDATGDANAVKMAGYPLVQSQTLQPASLICTFDGYRPEDVDLDTLEEKYQEALAENRLPEWLSFAEFRHKLLRKKGDIHIVCDKNADTSFGKTEMEEKARANVFSMLSFIRTLKGCEHATIKTMQSECALRETNRIVGEYEITEEDYVKGKIFDDAICYAYYPVDLHVKGGVTPKHLDEGTLPTIPLRALIPKGSRHLLVAGRCLSSDTLSNSALRVQVPCMAMGEGAGVTSALSARMSCPVSETPFSAVRAELKRRDCILPGMN